MRKQAAKTTTTTETLRAILIVLKFTERTYEEKEGIGVKESLLKSRVGSCAERGEGASSTPSSPGVGAVPCGTGRKVKEILRRKNGWLELRRRRRRGRLGRRRRNVLGRETAGLPSGHWPVGGNWR
jgi:hypothetical protein